MNISQEDAQASLSTVQNVTSKTRKTIASSYSCPMLILWGVLWIIAFVATHFYLAYAFYIFMGMTIVGMTGSFIFWHYFRIKAPLKQPSKEHMNWRIGSLWGAMIIYIFIWVNLLGPANGMQINAFICTAFMFLYIVIGLWFESYFMIVLGFVVTAATLVGFYLLRDYYCLWMAFVGGGALFGTGLYLRLIWR